MTTPKVQTALLASLRNMSFFPININTLPISSRMPSSSSEVVFNVRNNFNVFGHFFLWTGVLTIIDLLAAIGFLFYWIFMVKPYQTTLTIPIERPKTKPVVKPTSGKFRRHSIWRQALSACPRCKWKWTNSGTIFLPSYCWGSAPCFKHLVSPYFKQSSVLDRQLGSFMGFLYHVVGLWSCLNCLCRGLSFRFFFLYRERKERMDDFSLLFESATNKRVGRIKYLLKYWPC